MPDAPQKNGPYVLGLGSNVGDRMAHLTAAIHAIKSHDIHIIGCSRVYQTPPVGPPQPDYFNAAAAITTTLRAGALLDVLLGIERSLGRSRPDEIRWGPRTLDIDVLWYAGGIIAEPNLEVPHPRLNDRSFALKPLLDVLPEARCPRTGSRYADLPAAHEALAIVGPLPS